MSDSCNQDGVPLDNVRDVTGKNRAVHPAITRSSLPPQKWISSNRRANMCHVFLEALAEARLAGFIKQCSRAQFAARFRKKLKPHCLSESSSSAKTSSAGIDFDLPCLNFLILPLISRSQAALILAVIGGSSVDRMRCARVSR